MPHSQLGASSTQQRSPSFQPHQNHTGGYFSRQDQGAETTASFSLGAQEQPQLAMNAAQQPGRLAKEPISESILRQYGLASRIQQMPSPLEVSELNRFHN